LSHDDLEIRDAAMATLLTTARLRGQRERVAQTVAMGVGTGLNRTIYDSADSSTPWAKLVRCERGVPSRDPAVNDVYDAIGTTYRFFRDVFHRDSLDGKGLRLDAVVHYGSRFGNAFWNGARLVIGDGDGKALVGFTKSLDVIGHELTHGLTELTCKLEYHGQSGALSESIADVFGSLVKQYALGQRAADADWLIGAGVLGPALPGVALRSLKAPGTAYLGDDQPSSMARYVETPNTDAGDWGGVHRNAGIPNHAFYLVATGLGGYAWEEAGRIWYNALLAVEPTADFRAFAALTYRVAGERFGVNSRQQQMVGSAWAEVGVVIGAAQMILVTTPRGLTFKMKPVAAPVVDAIRIAGA
jgi:Zn-dependent metalloprotease